MDVLDSSQIGDQLRIQQEQFQTLIANLPGVAYRCAGGFGGQTEFISPAIASLCGYPPTDFTQPGGKTPVTLIHPADRERVQGEIEEAIAAQTTYSVEYRIITADGSLRWVSETGQGIFTPSEGLRWLDGVLLNVTEQKRAQEALYRAEARYRSLFENAIEGMFQTTPDGHYLSANTALARIYGYPSAEELTTNLVDISQQLYVDPHRRTEFIQLMQEHGTIANFESQVYRKDGSIIWISENIRTVHDSTGQLLYYEGSVRDITTRKRTEAALKAAEEKYRSLFENAVEGIYQTTVSGRIETANPMLALILGYSTPEALMSEITDVARQVYVDPNRRSEFTQLIQAHGMVRGFESEIYRRDGTTIWISENAHVLCNEQGEICGYEGTVEEITLFKRAEQIRESAELLQLILDNIPQSIFWKDHHSVYLGCNKKFAERVGLSSPTDIVGKTAHHLPGFSQMDADYFLECDRRVMQHDQAELHVEEIRVDAQGRKNWLERNKIPIHDAQGNVIGLLGTLEDITERKLAEEVLQQATAQAQAQAQQLSAALQTLQQTQTQLIQTEKMSSLGQLVAGVAHEINNPVNFIYGNISHAKGYVQDLLDTIHLYQRTYPTPPPEILEQLETIDLEFLIDDLPRLLTSMAMGADRIRQIVLSLRNFSRLDEAAVKSVNLHEGIDSTLLILQNRLKASSSHTGIQVIKDYGALPPVECYAGQINQVFMNILSNAIDALEELRLRQPPPIHPPTIQISTAPLTSGSVVIRFLDNGPGMPETVRQRLFDPFFTTKPVGKGTGLGLSISYQIIVEKHGGKLECLSTPGQGTEFRVEIPIHPYPISPLHPLN